MAEKITLEWVRMWRNDIDSDKKRVLLVGDSIINMAYKEIHKLLPEGLTSSKMMTSKGVCCEFLTKEIELVANQDGGEYEIVYFNNGLHFYNQTPEEYEENYRKRLDELKGIIKCDKWILGLSTPITKTVGDPTLGETPIEANLSIPFDAKNNIVIEYNKRVMKIAEDYGYDTYDAYSLMVEESHLKVDPYHYNSEGVHLLAVAVAKKIKEAYEK